MTKDTNPRSQRPGECALCVGCGGRIFDQFLLRVSPDLEWHAACLKCADCAQALDETCTCFVRDGKTYCKSDYVRLFGTQCAECRGNFSKQDLVMRARQRTYHIECFRCAACSRPLRPGDEFALREDGGLYCKREHCTQDFDKGHTAADDEREDNNNTLVALDSNCQLEIDQKSSPPNHNDSTSGVSKSRSRSLREQKVSRVRTVLNEKQLHTLRMCYNANPRPDALMKEQLTEMTGLSQRVIRVWFQNKRCKDKKRSILMQHLQQQQEKDGVASDFLQGIPMVASSPVRHEGPLPTPSPVEIHCYPSPWTTLTDFAMRNDLTKPPTFQPTGNVFNQEDTGTPPLPGLYRITPGMHSVFVHNTAKDSMQDAIVEDTMTSFTVRSESSDFRQTSSGLSSPLSQSS